VLEHALVKPTNPIKATEQRMPSLSSDIVGRVSRLPLKPSAHSALMPLFEAVSNSLHAVQDRFGDHAPELGEIGSVAHRTAGYVTGFTIKDNGIGLTSENYDSFLQRDTQHKILRRGKGVGRLGWLKVYNDIEVDSHYLEGEVLKRRDFEFVLAPQDQIVFKTDTPARSGISCKYLRRDPRRRSLMKMVKST
jgi:hypothetical protein